MTGAAALSIDRVILEVPSKAESKGLVDYAFRRGFHRFLLKGNLSIEMPNGAEVTLRQGNFLSTISGKELGLIQKVATPEELEEVGVLVANGGLTLVDFEGDSIIPLENLIARGGRRGTIWVTTKDPRRIPATLGALESGADGVVIPVETIPEVTQVESQLEARTPDLPWAEATLERVGPGGIGERVIVDTTSMLGPHEGLLVGSAGGYLFHVVSETQGSVYTRPRPFRVNAGALHSYTLLASGETRYLSELEPGDSVVVATPQRSARTVRVGRLKIERRPMTLIEGVVDGSRFTVFVQEAETVRLSGAQAPVAVTELHPGMKLWGVRLPTARHFGKAVEETIVER